MPGSVQSIERAAAVLRLLAAAPNGLGVADLGNALGLAKTTVHGILRTLHQVGFVEQDHTGAHYHLSNAFGRLGDTLPGPERTPQPRDQLGRLARLPQRRGGPGRPPASRARSSSCTTSSGPTTATRTSTSVRRCRRTRAPSARPCSPSTPAAPRGPASSTPTPPGRSSTRPGWPRNWPRSGRRAGPASSRSTPSSWPGIAAPIRGLGGLVVGAVGLTGRIERICDSRLRHRTDLITHGPRHRRGDRPRLCRTSDAPDGRAVRRRRRPGHQLHPVHPVRPARAAGVGRPAGAPAATSRSPAGSSTTPPRSGATSPGWCRRRSGRSAPQPDQIVAIGITNQRETSLLWDRRTGQPIGHAVVWQDTRTDRLVTELAGDVGPDRFADLLRPAADDVLLRAAAALDARPHARAARPRRAGRGALRHDGELADLELHRRSGRRPARDRRDERQSDDADEHRDAGVGRPAARRVRRTAGGAARDPAVVRRVRHGHRGAARRTDRGGARGSAGRAVRADLLQPRRGEVHVRHRLVSCCCTPARRSSGRPTECSPPSRTRSAPSRRRTRWKGRWRSPARWCSGSATGSG